MKRPGKIVVKRLESDDAYEMITQCQACDWYAVLRMAKPEPTKKEHKAFDELKCGCTPEVA